VMWYATSKVGRWQSLEVTGNEDVCISLNIARATNVSEATASSSHERFVIRWADMGCEVCRPSLELLLSEKFLLVSIDSVDSSLRSALCAFYSNIVF
jgi:hypothetical protein